MQTCKHEREQEERLREADRLSNQQSRAQGTRVVMGTPGLTEQPVWLRGSCLA